jgi:uncharacterized protein YdeI (BOF family)
VKRILFLLVILFIIKNGFSQPDVPEQFVLCVKKIVYENDTSSAVVLKFKPGRTLKIITYTRERLKSQDYVFLDSSIVMAVLTDSGFVKTLTIPFQDIVKIRGKVYGNAERKVAGIILAAGGLPLGYIPVFMAAYCFPDRSALYWYFCCRG